MVEVAEREVECCLRVKRSREETTTFLPLLLLSSGTRGLPLQPSS